MGDIDNTVLPEVKGKNMRKPILAALIAATALMPVMASAQEWQRGGRGANRGEAGAGASSQQRQEARQQMRAERQQQRAAQPQAQPQVVQVQQERRQQLQQRRAQQVQPSAVTNPANVRQEFRTSDNVQRQLSPQQRPDRQAFRQERRDDRQDFRQERREDRSARASGEVTREQFRDDRRDDRQDFRNDRRDDRQDFRRGNGRNDNRWNRGSDGNRGADWNRGDNRQGRAWNRTWRSDRNYNWQSYRSSNRNAYRLPRYYAPRGYGYGYQRFGIGVTLGALLFSQNYWINDPWSYRLPEAYEPYRWVRYYNDALLVDIYTGEVVDVIHDIFW